MSRHKAHIDLMYQDFKQRVCDGRRISPELIDKLAGGRVYTGLKAWTLIEDTDQMVVDETQAITPTSESLDQHKDDLQEVTDKLSVAPVSEDQLDIAITDPTTLIPSVAEILTDTEDQPVASLGVSSEECPWNAKSASPLGRGILDGIGGIRDAAIHGVEVYLARLLATSQQSEPEKTMSEILEDVLPGVPYQTNEEGHLMMSFDIRLKKCKWSVGYIILSISPQLIFVDTVLYLNHIPECTWRNTICSPSP